VDIGAPVLGITADGAGWPDSIETGPRERAETYTRSYTTALAVLALIAGELGAEGLGPEAVLAAADATEAALATPDEIPEARRLTAFAGLGPGQVTAREGALKLREAARLAGEGYDAEYLLHGNAVPLGAGDVLVLVGRDADGFIERLAEVARSAGVATAELEQPAPADELMAQIPLTARLQRLALERALAGGQDPDKVILAPWDDEALWAVGSP
jgi:glucosamine--fructose-6-phosphate aminotransferase (isomerizing)